MLFDIQNKSDCYILHTAIYPNEGNGFTVGLTSGCFDLFHSLHLAYLKRCRRMCDILLVGVDSDELVKATKGPERPIVPEHQRVLIVSELSCVSAAFIMGSTNELRTAINEFGASLLFRNQSFKSNPVIGEDLAKVVILSDVNQHDSTSGIIEEIKAKQTNATKT